MEGWVDLGSLIAARPWIEPTTVWSQVRCPNHYGTRRNSKRQAKYATTYLKSDDMWNPGLYLGISIRLTEVATPVVITWNFTASQCFSAQQVQPSRSAEARICRTILYTLSISVCVCILTQVVYIQNNFHSDIIKQINKHISWHLNIYIV